MAISSVSDAAVTTPSQSSLRKLADNYDNFLKLLTTQLKHQDPLKPMDSKEFTQQLTQFAAVEQSIQTNKNLESLLLLQQANQTSLATSFIGKTIEMIGDKQLLKDGTAKFSYTIPSGAVKGNILIRNEAGTLVYQGTADHTTGLHSFTWDGKDTQGVQQPDGVYTVQVSANDEKDVPLTVPLMTSGRVTGMEISDQGPILLVGSVKVPLDTVVKVKES